MAKKLVTIDVNDDNLKVSAKPVKAKEAKIVESNEMEKLGFVEINNSSSKKVAKAAAKGFEKNLSEGTKKAIKSQTSLVEDYFDFSFRVNEKSIIEKEESVDTKVVAKKTTKTVKKTATKVAEESKIEAKVDVCEIKIDEDLKQTQTVNVTNYIVFDNEVSQILNVARIGSLFDCDKRAIQA